MSKEFFPLFLESYNRMLMTSNDLERLRYGVQRVEDGVFFNFKGKEMFKAEGFPELSITLIDAERINSAKRYTDTLKNEYETGLLELVKAVGCGVVQDEPTQEVSLWDELLLVVKDGDKETFRGMRKDIKKQLTTYMNPDDIEDAILDLGDAVADKDIELANEVLKDLDEGNTVPAVADKTKEVTQSLTEDEKEILEDIKSAVADKDKVDFKELIKELAAINSTLAAKIELDNIDVFTSPETKEAVKEKTVADEIIEDLEKAIADDDKKEITLLLEELKDEDVELHTEWSAKVAPVKKERKRRGK